MSLIRNWKTNRIEQKLYKLIHALKDKQLAKLYVQSAEKYRPGEPFSLC